MIADFLERVVAAAEASIEAERHVGLTADGQLIAGQWVADLLSRLRRIARRPG